MASRGGNVSSQPEMEEKEKDKDKDQGATAAAVAVGAAAGVAALAAWGISKWFGSSEPEPAHEAKMMRAPGKPDEYMPRNEFEENPSTYFRDLRGKK